MPILDESEFQSAQPAPRSGDVVSADAFNSAPAIPVPEAKPPAPKSYPIPFYDVPADTAKAFGESWDSLKENLKTAFPDFEARAAQAKADTDKYGRMGRFGMDFVHQLERLGASGKAAMDVLGIVSSPITGAVHGTLGSALSYLWPGGKENADTALDTALMAARPAGVGVRAPVATRGEREVARRIEQQVKGGGPDADAMLARAAETPDKPLTLMDVGEEPLDQLTGRIARAPGEGSQIITKTLRERNLGEFDRVAADLDKAFGKGSAFKTERDLLRQRAAASGPRYAEVEQLDGIWSPRLQDLLADADIQNGLARGFRLEQREALAQNRPFDATQMGVDLDAEGNVKLLRTPNMRVLDMAKRGLDAMIAEQRNDLTGKLSTEGRSIEMLRKAYLGELDALDTQGVYRAARDAWAGPSASMDAVRVGRTALRRSPEEIAEQFGRLDPAQRVFAQLGAKEALLKRVMQVGDGADQAKKVAGNPYIRRQVEAMVGDPAAAEQFLKDVQAEILMRDKMTKHIGGSDAARRLAEDASPGAEAAADAAHAVLSGFMGHTLSAGRSALRSVRNTGRMRDPATNAEIANILTSPLSGAPQRGIVGPTYAPALNVLQNPGRFRPSVVDQYSRRSGVVAPLAAGAADDLLNRQ